MDLSVSELGIEIGKEFFIVAIAVWILTGAISKIPKVTTYLAKELLAYIIGIIAIIVGYFTGLFKGNILWVLAVGIIAISIAQYTVEKFWRKIVENYKFNKALKEKTSKKPPNN